MDVGPRYAIETLDQVLRAMGCVGGQRPDRAWAWKLPSRKRAGHSSYFVYVPDRGCPWIRQDHVVEAALRLEQDPSEVVRRLKEKGGEILDP